MDAAESGLKNILSSTTSSQTMLMTESSHAPDCFATQKQLFLKPRNQIFAPVKTDGTLVPNPLVHSDVAHPAHMATSYTQTQYLCGYDPHICSAIQSLSDYRGLCP